MKTAPPSFAIDDRAARPGAWLLTGLAAVLLAGAAPLEVVRVRLPVDQVPALFPPGTELRGLSLKELDALTAAARAGAERAARSAAPRLLRARHFARWDAGVLIGRSELDVEPAEAGPAELVLGPWTPAIDPGGSRGADLRVHDTGRTALWIEARTGTTITLSWQLRARSGSRARGFSLGLPVVPISLLELDLPVGWTPEGPAGVRQGPRPSATTGRQIWRFEGPGGSSDLRLHEPSAVGSGAARLATPIWVSGSTRIDLSELAPRPNWRADWTVDAEPQGPRGFAVELDQGLDLIDVSGPGVDEYQAEAQGSGTRLTIKLKDEELGPTLLSIRALTHAPFEGAWTVPAARPSGAPLDGGYHHGQPGPDAHGDGMPRASRPTGAAAPGRGVRWAPARLRGQPRPSRSRTWSSASPASTHRPRCAGTSCSDTRSQGSAVA